jgi:hypothetical protein
MWYGFPMRQILIQSITYLLPTLLPIIGAYLAMLARKYVHNDGVLKALQGIGQLAEVAVANAAQRTVLDLKDPNKDGTWDKTAAQAVKKSVSDDVRSMAAPLLAKLSTYGWSEAKREILIDQLIEAAVLSLKRVSIPPAAPTLPATAPVVAQ